MQSTIHIVSNKELDQARTEGDALADKVVETLFTEGYNPVRSDAYNLFQHNNDPIPAEFPAVLKDYFEEIRSTEIPKDVAKLGTDFFVAHAQEVMICLGLLALPYCYAAADGAKVLVQSNRILKNPEKRLNETATFVWDVCTSDAFSAEGKGYISIAKVRLMHAAVRYHVKNADKWDMQWGLPINQEDMAATNLAFSLITIRGIRKLGIQVMPKKALQYITFWNAIGRLLGVKSTLLPKSNKEAFQLDKKIAERQFRVSKEGVALTKSLTDYLKKQELPLPVSPIAIMHYLLGPEVALLLQVEVKDGSVAPVMGLKQFNRLKSFLSRKNSRDFMALEQQFQARKNQMEIQPFRFLDSLQD